MSSRPRATAAKCPFCGSKRSMVRRVFAYYRSCWDCYATGPSANSKRRATILWNRRAAVAGRGTK